MEAMSQNSKKPVQRNDVMKGKDDNALGLNTYYGQYVKTRKYSEDHPNQDSTSFDEKRKGIFGDRFNRKQAPAASVCIDIKKKPGNHLKKFDKNTEYIRKTQLEEITRMQDEKIKGLVKRMDIMEKKNV